MSDEPIEGVQETPSENEAPYGDPLIFQAERGGVAWMDLWGKVKDEAGVMRPVHISLTERAENAESALRGLLQALSVAKSEFHLNPFPPDGPSATPAQPAQPAPPAGTAPAAPAAPAAPGAGAPPANGQPNQIFCDRIDVSYDGQKATVKFIDRAGLENGIKTTGAPAVVAQRFGGGWTPQHFMVTTSYSVGLIVGWALSQKTNQFTGQPFKNVVFIRPA